MSNMHGGYFPAQKMLMNIPTTTRSDTTDSLALFSVSTQFAVRIPFFSQPASMYLINCKEWFFLIILYRRLDKRIMSGPYFSFRPLAEKTFCICHNQPSKVFRTMTDFVHAQRETGGSICLLARMALRVLILRDVTNSIFLMQLKRPSSMFLPPEGTCQPHKNVWIFQTVMRTVKQTNKQAELQTMEILKRTLNYGMGP